MTSQPRKACLCHWAHIPSLYWKFECSNLDGISSILCGCHSRFWQLYRGDSGNCPTCSTPQCPHQERGIFPLEPGLWCCLQKTQRSFPDQTSDSHAIQHQHIMTNASLTASERVLMKADINGDHHGAFCSQTFSPAERNHDIYDRELLAVIHAP